MISWLRSHRWTVIATSSLATLAAAWTSPSIGGAMGVLLLLLGEALVDE